MKAFLLTVASALMCSVSAFAQRDIAPNFPPDYRWDIGINYGGSAISRPLGPQSDYQGNRTDIVPEYGVRVTRFINPHWSVGYDLAFRRWETYGTWSNPYLMGTSLKKTDVKFTLGNPAISNSIQVNYILPFYTKYSSYNKANINFGITLGVVNTVSDASTGYTKYNAAPDSNYKYISNYNYASAMGYSIGAQIGYTYYITPRLGVNVEVAARFVSMTAERANGVNDVHGTDKYHLLFLPQTFGIRYRLR